MNCKNGCCFQQASSLKKKKTFAPDDCGLGAAEEVDLASWFTLILKSAQQFKLKPLLFIQSVYLLLSLVLLTT